MELFTQRAIGKKEHTTCTQSITSAAQSTSRKCPKKQAVEYAKQINDNPTGAFTESVKLAQSAEARDIMQKRLFAKSIFHRHSDVYGMSMSELVNTVNEYCC